MRANVVLIVVALASCAPPPVGLTGTGAHDDSSSDDGSKDGSSTHSSSGGTTNKSSDSSGDDDDDDDDTASGPPLAQSRSAGGADAGVHLDAGKSTCPSFTQDVLPGLDGAGCTAFLCHGSVFAQAIRIDTSDPAGTYAQLTSFVLGSKPYVKPGATDPKASAMHCHLSGLCGDQMPPNGTVPPALVTTVDSWLACGAPAQ